MPVTTSGYSHVRLTVTDIDASRAFYDQVFGFPVAYEIPPDADEATLEQLSFLFGGVIYQVPGGLFGLRPVAPGDDAFDTDRVGLDHLSFAVADEAALTEAAAVLDELGVAHGGLKDIGEAVLLEFNDPDGISLELMAAKG